jgi:hypothetical protein
VEKEKFVEFLRYFTSKTGKMRRRLGTILKSFQINLRVKGFKKTLKMNL